MEFLTVLVEPKLQRPTNLLEIELQPLQVLVPNSTTTTYGTSRSPPSPSVVPWRRLASKNQSPSSALTSDAVLREL